MVFPGITAQAKWIAKIYKFAGLYSIPVLTLVTIISIANVFTKGQIASANWVQILWAFIFATAIEVNIVRLFFEWKLDKNNGALWLGICLVVVAGAALLLEGLQQSISFAWTAWYMQIVVGCVVGLRVFVVVLLIAREGSRLATALQESEQPIYACLVQFPEPKPERKTEQAPERITEPNITAFPNVTKRKALQPIEREVQRLRNKYPDWTLEQIGQRVGRSKTGVHNILKRLAEQQVAKEA